jgi:hypothetical protein
VNGRLFLVALLFSGTAVARKPKPSSPPVVDQQALEEQACQQKKVEGFQIRTGFFTHDDPAEAINGAKRAAKTAAIEVLCANRGEASCAILRKHIEDWGPTFYNPVTHRACAHAGIHRDWVDNDRGDQLALHRNIIGLAQQIRAKAHLLKLEPPLWGGTGCSAGEVGAALLNELKNALADGQTRIADADAEATSVQLVLEPRGAEVTLSVSLREPGHRGELLLEGFAFAADLFKLDDSRGDCRFDQDLGLVAGKRLGAAGEIGIDIGSRGVFCEGEQVEPTVWVSRPSTVKVYSVSRSGQAILVWPPIGGDGVVERALPLGRMALTISPGGGDEKLVAVAMPLGSDFGDTEGWTAICMTPQPFSSRSYPRDASVGAATFTVLPFDANYCLTRNVVSQSAEPMKKYPTCPQASPH